jgi:hypothetical protein
VTCNANYGNCDGNNTNGCEVNLLTDNSNCGSCGHACATGTCQSGTCASTAAQCVTGADATTGSPYVICSVTASDIWISANNAGSYYPAAICTLYGYSTVAQWGGTCGSVCAYCQGATSCSSPGNETFDVGAYSGGSISDTVMWRCTRERSTDGAEQIRALVDTGRPWSAGASFLTQEALQMAMCRICTSLPGGGFSFVAPWRDCAERGIIFPHPPRRMRG